jgi:PAS domain-containing protein
VDAKPLADEQIQLTLLGEAVAGSNVGFLVWDDDGRYVAVNDCACKILGCNRDELLGSRVGAHTHDGENLVADAVRTASASGRAVVDRFDGSGSVEVNYLTFATRTAGLPYMGSVIWEADV